MSNQQKMQNLFDAALRSNPDSQSKLKQVAPEPKLDVAADAPSSPAPEQMPIAAEAVEMATTVQAVEFNKTEAEELGSLLDEQMARSTKKRKRELVMTLLVVGGTTLGGVGWFVSDANRVKALTSVISDIRSVSDVGSIVSKFQNSLDRIAVRGNQIDQATAALGVTSTPGELKDEFMEEEMKEMMGEEGGKTVGERNKMMQKAFAKRAEEAAEVPTAKKDDAKLKEFQKENAFGWEK